jgi:hypothetical protein
MHARAKELFELENPGRLWRPPVGTPAISRVAQEAASLIERQNYLSRIRAQMQAEGAKLVTEAESRSETLRSRNYVLPQR